MLWNIITFKKQVDYSINYINAYTSGNYCGLWRRSNCFQKNIYNYNTFFFIRYIFLYIYVIYQTIESIISKKEINNLIPIFVSVIIIMLALIQETSRNLPMINSFESMLTIIILIIFNFIYNKKELIKWKRVYLF